MYKKTLFVLCFSLCFSILLSVSAFADQGVTIEQILDQHGMSGENVKTSVIRVKTEHFDAATGITEYDYGAALEIIDIDA